MKLRALAALLTGALLTILMGVFARADAAPAAGRAPIAYPPSICSTVSVSTTRPNLGDQITVTGKNFEPKASVVLRLYPKGHKSETTATYPAVITDAAGGFVTKLQMPTGTTNRGAYILEATTGYTRSGQCPADPSVGLQLGGTAAGNGGTNGGGGNGGTAFTGLDVAALIGLAGLLLVVGGAFVYRGRRATV